MPSGVDVGYIIALRVFRLFHMRRLQVLIDQLFRLGRNLRLECLWNLGYSRLRRVKKQMTKYGVKDFLTDLSTGMTSKELIRKYNLSDEKLNWIFGRLRRSDLLALRGLWEQGKLTDSQFMRAFEEVENDLKGDD